MTDDATPGRPGGRHDGWRAAPPPGPDSDQGRGQVRAIGTPPADGDRPRAARRTGRRPARAPVAPRLEGAGRACLVWLIAVCCLIEAALQAGDLAGLPLRAAAYEWGAFWPGLLADWRPVWPGQSVAMFGTYGFLHGGLLHLGINMLTLWTLGMAVILRSDVTGFALVYAAGLVGGGLGYALLATDPRVPMVGASGALFALAGAFLAWHLADRVALAQTVAPVLKAVAFLAAVNVAMAVAMAGQLAWEAHLGGFVVGAAMALALALGRSA